MKTAKENKFTQLDTWLAEHNAKNIRNEELINGDMINWIAVNGRVIILQSYANEKGWDIYVPASDSNSIAQTIEALAVRLK